MRALTIRQPWAHLIIHGAVDRSTGAMVFKDVENRSYRTRRRGEVFIHAAQSWGVRPAEWESEFPGLAMPAPEDVLRGGIIGTVWVIDCVEHSESPFFKGPFGWMLASPSALPFRDCSGALGFWRV